MQIIRNYKTVFIQAGVWILFLILAAVFSRMSFGLILSQSIQQSARHILLALAMIATIKIGVGPNLALPIGVVCGYLAMLFAIQYDFAGVLWLMISLVIAIFLAVIVGYGYGKLLARMKGLTGTSMMINWALGFAVVGIMSILYMILPFNNANLRMFLGQGIRGTIDLLSVGNKEILDNFLSISVGQVTIPAGLILILAAACFLLWNFFLREKGVSAELAEPAAVIKSKDCLITGIITTVLGAAGAVVYAQSYGFIHTYSGGSDFTLWVLPAIFLGGVTLKKAGIRQAVMGILMFSGLMALLLVLARSEFMGADLIVKLLQLAPYGIIIYVLLKSPSAQP